MKQVLQNMRDGKTVVTEVPIPTPGKGQALVRVAARGRTAADIAAIPVKRPGGIAVQVGDVAQVVDGIVEPRNAAFLDERPALALAGQPALHPGRSAPGERFDPQAVEPAAGIGTFAPQRCASHQP